MKKLSLSLFSVIIFAIGAHAQTTATTMAGMTMDEINRKNKEGAAKVAAIKPTKTPLSSADKALMMKVAAGGLMQLQVSQAALSKVSSEEVRALAQAEVEEQTGLSAKLKEIATAKGFMLPTTPDPKTTALLTKMEGMSGSDLDQFYVSESGVKGHEELDKVMTNVKSKAKDSNLSALAAAAHPLVTLHLKVSRALQQSQSATGSSK